MYRCILIFILLFPCRLPAQEKPVFGEVKADKLFKCTEYAERDAVYATCNPVENICNSKYELEIRLHYYSMPHGGEGLIIVTYGNNKWDARMYKYERASLGYQLQYTIAKPEFNNMYNYSFSLVFDTLKSNHIFLLPSQAELPVKGWVSDGVGYAITFKAGDQFRTYYFNNPKSYMQMNENLPELKQYETIVRNLFNLFN